MIFSELAINEPFHRPRFGTGITIWVKLDDMTCILPGVSRPVPTPIEPTEEVVRIPEVYHPATRYKYVTMRSGQNIGPPGVFTPSQVRMSDIRAGISKTCRYNGQIDGWYSVAEHSVLVSRIAEIKGDTEAIIPALFHDAHEAYMGDIASPHKDMMGPGCKTFERSMELIVREALGLGDVFDEVWARVKEYDTIILHRELVCLRTIMPDWYDPNMDDLVPAEIQPVGLEWPDADSLFRSRMSEVNFKFPGFSQEEVDSGSQAR